MKKRIDFNKNWTLPISVFLLFIGIVLLVYMIVMEDEPGAVPIIFILSGIMLLLKNKT